MLSSTNRVALALAVVLLTSNLVNANTINLRADNSVVGHARINWPTGKSQNAKSAIISLFQDGEIVATVEADPNGRFVFEDLLPGEYTAQITVAEGSAEFDLNVVSGQTDIGDHLTASLTPTPDGCGCEVIVDHEPTSDDTIWEPTEDFVDPGYVDAPMEYDYGYVDGGYTGGGFTGGGAVVGGGAAAGFAGGGGGLLGGGLLGPLAGAAGLAGLAAIDDDDQPVSPAMP